MLPPRTQHAIEAAFAGVVATVGSVSASGSALTRKGAERRARRFIRRTIRTWDQERRTSYSVAVEDPK